MEPQKLEAVLDTIERHAIPTEEGQLSNVFCCTALADATQGTLCTDIIEVFPVQLFEGNQTSFVTYDYDINTSFELHTTNFQDWTMIQAFQQIFSESKDKGYVPNLM